MPHLESGAVVEPPHLPRHGLGDLRMGVAERAAPQSRETVEQTPAFHGRVVRAFGVREDSRLGALLEIAIVGEGHPVSTGTEVHGRLQDCGFMLHRVLAPLLRAAASCGAAKPGKQLSYTSGRRELTLARQKSCRRGRRARPPARPPERARYRPGGPQSPRPPSSTI